MKRFYQLYRTRIVTAIALIMLGIWSLSSTAIALLKKDRIVVMKIDANGDSAVIGEAEDSPIAEPFFRRYVQYMYNYDSNSFESNVQKCLPLLSQSFWDKMKPDYLSSIEKIKERKVMQSAAITSKIAVLGNSTYAFSTQSTVSKDLSDGKRIIEEQSYKLIMTIKKVPRTIENPFGWEVQNVTEERI